MEEQLFIKAIKAPPLPQMGKEKEDEVNECTQFKKQRNK